MQGSTPTASILELVEALSAQRLTAQRVRRATGIELSRVESENPYWSFFESDDDSKRAVARIELRMRTSPPESGESLLVLELGVDHCLPVEDVLAKYGREPSLNVPTPHGPPEQRVYYIYSFDWGRLSFGARDTKSGCVTNVVLETGPNHRRPGGERRADPAAAPLQPDSIVTLELALLLDAKTYALGRPATGTLILKNSGDESLLVNARLAINNPYSPQPFREVYFLLTDPSGKSAAFGPKINIGRPRSEDFRDLPPGKTADLSFRLDRYYTLDQPGEYSVQAVYENHAAPGDGRATWKGRLESNLVSFVVVP